MIKVRQFPSFCFPDWNVKLPAGQQLGSVSKKLCAYCALQNAYNPKRELSHDQQKDKRLYSHYINAYLSLTFVFNHSQA
jgi:hypothetical protein